MGLEIKKTPKKPFCVRPWLLYSLNEKVLAPTGHAWVFNTHAYIHIVAFLWVQSKDKYMICLQWSKWSKSTKKINFNFLYVKPYITPSSPTCVFFPLLKKSSGNPIEATQTSTFLTFPNYLFRMPQ